MDILSSGTEAKAVGSCHCYLINQYAATPRYRRTPRSVSKEKELATRERADDMHFVFRIERRFHRLHRFFIDENLNVLPHSALFINHAKLDSGKLFVEMIEQIVNACAFRINLGSAFCIRPQWTGDVYEHVFGSRLNLYQSRSYGKNFRQVFDQATVAGTLVEASVDFTACSAEVQAERQHGVGTHGLTFYREVAVFLRQAFVMPVP